MNALMNQAGNIAIIAALIGFLAALVVGAFTYKVKDRRSVEEQWWDGQI